GDERAEVGRAATAVPKGSHAFPPERVAAAAVRSIPASPNSLVPSDAELGLEGLIVSLTLPPVFTAPSAAEIACCGPQHGGESEPTSHEPLVTHFEIRK